MKSLKVIQNNHLKPQETLLSSRKNEKLAIKKIGKKGENL